MTPHDIEPSSFISDDHSASPLPHHLPNHDRYDNAHASIAQLLCMYEAVDNVCDNKGPVLVIRSAFSSSPFVSVPAQIAHFEIDEFPQIDPSQSQCLLRAKHT